MPQMAPKVPMMGSAERAVGCFAHRQNRTRTSDLPSGLATERRVQWAMGYSLSLCVYVRRCG